FSITKIMSAQDTWPAVTLIRAPGSVPADRACMPLTPSKIFSAVRLRQRFRLQTNKTFRQSIDGYFNFFTNTFELRPLWSYFSRRLGGKSSGVPSAKPPLD